MFCNKCGANLPDGTRTCTNCGADLAGQAQPVYQQPVYQQPVYQQQPVDPGKGLGIAAMVLGIISLLCFPYILGTLGIILGAVGLNKSKAVGMKNGMAVAGIVLGIIGIALWVLMLIFAEDIAAGLINSMM